MTKVSLIIPTKNEEKNIGRCLKSIQSSVIDHHSSLEIIVVDNQSTDQTVAIAQKLGAKVFQSGPERSSQRNFGAKKATGEILFFVDADMELEEKVLIEAISLFNQDSDIKSIVVPEVSVGNNFWGQVRSLERSCYLGEPLIEAARIFKRKVFFQTGGFDESLIAAEDWDLNQKVAKLGKMARTKHKIIHHEENFSLLNHLKKKYYYAKNIKYYLKKHPDESKAQIGPARVKFFWKNWQKLATDPIHGAGVFILKSMEYFVYLVSLVK